MIRFAIVLLAASAAFAGDDITSIGVWSSHGEGDQVRTERITASLEKQGPVLSIRIEARPAPPVETRVELPAADWKALVRFVASRGIDAWKNVPAAVADWGSEGFDIAGKVTKSVKWNGPWVTTAAPVLLQRRMADLARTLAPKSELAHFAGSSPVLEHIRLWSSPWFPVNEPEGANPSECEVEAREGSWTIRMARRRVEGEKENRRDGPDAWLAPDRTAQITKEEWEAFREVVVRAKIADWKESEARPVPDYGFADCETNIGDMWVHKRWSGAVDETMAPGKIAKAFFDLAAKHGIKRGD